VGLVGFTTMMN
jgi:hypothetical protein